MIFGFKRKAKTTTKLLCHEQLQDGLYQFIFQLESKNTIVPIQEWRNSNHPGAIWLLDYLHDNDLIQKDSLDNLSIRLRSEQLIEILKGQECYLQHLLELPPLFDGGLHIECQGLLAKDDYTLNYSWIDGNSRPITLSDRRGIFLIFGNKKYLLSYFAWKFAEDIDAIQERLHSSNSMHERLQILESFKSIRALLPEEESRKFSDDGSISNIKLYFANAFRIDAIPEGNSFKIQPVLLKRHETQNQDCVFENILPPVEQQRYNDQFSNSTKLQPYYTLGPGKYILINDQLNKALSTVHKIQHSNDTEKLNFLKNPKAALADSLEGMISDEELNLIFSDRVTGIGEWNAKVIPWIQLPPGEWIPDGKFPNSPFGIDIAGKKIQFETITDLSVILDKIKEAKKSGALFVDHEGINIPVNDRSISALEKFIPRQPLNNEDNKHNQANSPDQDRILQTPVMLVKENLEYVEFHVVRIPRNRYPQSSKLPETIRTEPKQHQVEAYKWLCAHYKAGSRGVLLADDMGLGKTFQSLMFLEWLREGMIKEEICDKPLLIVAPTGLLKNWEAEVQKHLLNGLGNIARVYGSDLKSLRTNNSLNVSKIKSANLVLTTYDTLTRYQTSFGVISFSTVVFDEIQKLKNPGTQNYSAACSLNCDFWLGMTGTPVENRLCDLWSITDVLQPGMLGSIKEFSNKYEKCILDIDEYEQQNILKELQDGLTKGSEANPPFMLRRMKSSVLTGLPKKNVHIIPVEMPQKQASTYSQILNQVKNMESKNGVMLKAIHQLRACSLHPDYKRQDEYINDNEYIGGSARLKACFEILDKIYAKREKALIFIEYNEWHRHDFLCQIIKTKYKLDRLPMAINGQINSKTRQHIVDKFQEERGKFDVMLLSPRAGGVGITLTAANHIIHLTRWWNPAVEDQANDRIYRIGQESDVHIYYPLAIHAEYENSCFDYNLHQLLEKKRELSQQVIIAPPIEQDAIDQLFAKTFNKSPHSKISINESYYGFDGNSYEEFILEKLQNKAPLFGFHAKATKKSWDKGADIIIESDNGNIVAIVQCKHVSCSTKTPPDIPEDLDKAVKHYVSQNNPPIFKIGITNASKLRKFDTDWLRSSSFNQILYADQGLRPELLLKLLS
ncbi:TPA: SNF2-related protein [Legionella pneumophila]|nr:DEAD/DEAH box helicase [Legionella pneumophila]HDO8005729.1 DEAD/DEAH box helicase [Legionella pneumophila]HDO9975759.1 DEAD/DEAH box helicase [Legionella pneumophila]